MGNDNEARRDVIISRLLNRSAPKKNNCECKWREIYSQYRAELQRRPVVKLQSSMTVSKAERPHRSWQPLVVISGRKGGGRVYKIKPGSAPSRSKHSSLGRQNKNHRQSIILQQLFPPANDCLWKSEALQKSSRSFFLQQCPKIGAGCFLSI